MSENDVVEKIVLKLPKVRTGPIVITQEDAEQAKNLMEAIESLPEPSKDRMRFCLKWFRKASMVEDPKIKLSCLSYCLEVLDTEGLNAIRYTQQLVRQLVKERVKHSAFKKAT